MDNNVKNILIVGVGGQGTLLASKILGNVLLSQGYDVKVSEVHGMSQRGGSVVTYVRYGDKVYSSLVEKGEADVRVLHTGDKWYGMTYAEDHAKVIAALRAMTDAGVYPEKLWG